jgi:hypothetical protein
MVLGAKALDTPDDQARLQLVTGEDARQCIGEKATADPVSLAVIDRQL